MSNKVCAEDNSLEGLWMFGGPTSVEYGALDLESEGKAQRERLQSALDTAGRYTLEELGVILGCSLELKEGTIRNVSSPKYMRRVPLTVIVEEKPYVLRSFGREIRFQPSEDPDEGTSFDWYTVVTHPNVRV